MERPALKPPGAGPRSKLREWFYIVEPYCWIAPACVILATFTYVPILLESGLSFFSANGVNAARFIGPANYEEALHNPDFWDALAHNGWYAAVTVVAKLALALVLALLLNLPLRGRAVMRSVFFLPVVLSFVAIGIIWTLIYNYDYGVLNALLSSLGFAFLKQDWLGSPDTAFGAVMLVDVWKWTGFHLVIYLAGLQSIPSELYEAAAIDGAGRWTRFRHVTLPLLRPYTAINLLLACLGAFSVFDLVYVMTQGGPFKATNVVMIEVYLQAFQFNRLGYAAAMSVLLLLLVTVISVVVLRVFGSQPAKT
jgi:ABC-type sugar transport system permease subunit